MTFPEPVIGYAIEAKTQALIEASSKLMEMAQAQAQAQALALYGAYPSLMGSAGLGLSHGSMLESSLAQRLGSLEGDPVTSSGLPGNGVPSAPPSSRENSSGHSSPGDGVSLALRSDEENLSEYQCFIRAHIELFSAKVRDIECNAQGRNKPIVVGQVGIRCKACACIPPGRRPRGAVYFPAKLTGLYQAAQNM